MLQTVQEKPDTVGPQNQVGALKIMHAGGAGEMLLLERTLVLFHAPSHF